jgi:hypothetical protein
MPTTDLTPIRLTGRRGLVAAVPALLGFHPRESVVLLCLRSPTRRIGPVIRVDLEDDAAHPSDFLIAQLTVHANRHAHEVAVLCFTERQDVPRMVHELIAALQEQAFVCSMPPACARGTFDRSLFPAMNWAPARTRGSRAPEFRPERIRRYRRLPRPQFYLVAASWRTGRRCVIRLPARSVSGRTALRQRCT